MCVCESECVNVNSILSNREIQTVENCIRNVSTDRRLFLKILLTLLVCVSCFCGMNLHFVLNIFHVFKEILILFFSCYMLR